MRLLNLGRAAARLMLCCFLLSACASPTTPPTIAAPTYPPVPTLTRVVESPLPAKPPDAPTAHSDSERIFPNLAAALPWIDFDPLIPAYVPDNLPLARVTLSAQNELSLLYALSSQVPKDSPRLLALAQTSSAEPVNESTLTDPGRGALDIQPGIVRGQPAFFYWTHSEGGRPSYRLAWREHGVNLSLALTGSWNPAGASNPHSLDPLLQQIASGLTFETGAWQTVTVTGSGISFEFAIPPAWTEDGVNAYRGVDGFARLEPFDGPGATLTQVCEWEANAHPDRYGPQPEISLVHSDPNAGPLCLARPDSGQAAIFLPHLPGRVLRVDAPHALAVARSIRLPRDDAPAKTAVVNPGPASLAAQSLTWNGLSVDIYSLGPLSSPSAEVMLTAPPEALEKRRATREQPAPAADRAAHGNQTLALRSTTIEHPFTQNGQIQVLAGDQVIYRFNHLAPGDARAARLFSYQQDWILNTGGFLVVNGQITNQQLGYDRLNSWTLIGGRPFYFFEKDGLARISYDGALFPVVFDQVLEDYPRGSNENMAWFYALRNGQVFYIEMAAR